MNELIERYLIYEVIKSKVGVNLNASDVEENPFPKR